jgi:hypothetical protein
MATQTGKKAQDKSAPKTEGSNDSLYKGEDEFERMLITQTEKIIGQFSEVSTKLAAADGDRDKAMKTFIESSDHPEAVAIRLTIQEANARLKQLAEENVVSLTLSEEEKAKLKTLSSTLKEQAKAALETLEGTAKLMSVDSVPFTEAVAALKSRMPVATRGRKPGDSGSSLPRPRVNLYVTGGNLKPEQHFESFSKLALTLNCDTADIQKSYAAKAGVDPMDVKSIKDPVTFEFQPNENGAKYVILATPKETQKTGPKPKSESVQAEGNAEAKTEETPAA